MSVLQTEFEFTLPRGYIDAEGNLHRQGIMRLATARDEIEPLQDGRVQANDAYLTILLLSRVLVQLGTINPVPPLVVESLFASDFTYLQDLYLRINEDAGQVVETQCPACRTRFSLDLASEKGAQ